MKFTFRIDYLRVGEGMCGWLTLLANAGDADAAWRYVCRNTKPSNQMRRIEWEVPCYIILQFVFFVCGYAFHP